MKPEKLAQHLSETVRKLGYRLRQEDGNFRGGRCLLDEEKIIILNRRMSAEEKCELLARVLSGENLDEVYLLPEVRAFIEKQTAGRMESGIG